MKNLKKTLLRLFCAGLFLGSGPWVIADGIFAPQTLYPVGDHPSSVAIGDFDGDGRQDLAIAITDRHPYPTVADEVLVLLGNGDGSFAPQTLYPVGRRPWSVAIGDFDDDGQQDLVVANGYESNVSILLGNGNGSFATATHFPAGRGPMGVAIGDFDGDGRQDLALANEGSDDVSVLLGIGDGSFASHSGYPAGRGPMGVAIGDFDGDGRQDLAVANQGSDDLSVLLGIGDGSFAPQTSYPVGDNPVSVAVGDFDDDGRQDLVVANWSDNDVSVLLGNGGGSFAAQNRYPSGRGSRSLVIGDFDSNGQQDLAVTNSLDRQVSVLLGDGDGSFATASGYPVGGHPVSVACGDFDGNGQQDLTVANHSSDDVSVLLNRLPRIVDIDILPHDLRNRVKPNSFQLIPVALLGRDDLEVAEVDLTSLRFGPDEAEPAHALTRPPVAPGQLQDVNGDGVPDLISHYRVRETGIACGEETATLRGTLTSGQAFEGSDSVWVLGCGLDLELPGGPRRGNLSPRPRTLRSERSAR